MGNPYTDPPSSTDDSEFITRQRVAASLFAAFLTFSCAQFFRPSLLAFLIWYACLEFAYSGAWQIIKRNEYMQSKISSDFRHDRPDYFLYRLVSFAFVFFAWGLAHQIANRSITLT